MTWRTWRQAMQEALYGPEGFYLHHSPTEHFRTSVAIAPFATAVRRLAGRVDDALGHPDPFDVVDVGAGRGELLGALRDVPTRWRLTGVELAPDPGGALRWMPRVPPLTGLLLANEWLDNVPLDVVSDGRLVEVSRAGEERLGGPAPADLLEWCRRWWPQGRAEVGLARDVAWAAAVGQVQRGLAVAVDYGHFFDERRPTLTGYRRGRQVALPVPDGTCDLTAHVSLDSCAAHTGSRLLSQREALTRLGLSGSLPTPGGHGYALALQEASQVAELLAPAGLGGFSWLVRAVGITDPLTLPA